MASRKQPLDLFTFWLFVKLSDFRVWKMQAKIFHDSGKTLRFMMPNDAPKLHQGLTESRAAEALGKRHSTPNQLTRFKVYQKDHEGMSTVSSSVEWEWIFLTEVWQHSRSRGRGVRHLHWDLGERLPDLTIISWSVSAIQDETMPERPEGISQGTVKTG